MGEPGRRERTHKNGTSVGAGPRSLVSGLRPPSTIRTALLQPPGLPVAEALPDGLLQLPHRLHRYDIDLGLILLTEEQLEVVARADFRRE